MKIPKYSPRYWVRWFEYWGRDMDPFTRSVFYAVPFIAILALIAIILEFR